MRLIWLLNCRSKFCFVICKWCHLAIRKFYKTKYQIRLQYDIFWSLFAVCKMFKTKYNMKMIRYHWCKISRSYTRIQISHRNSQFINKTKLNNQRELFLFLTFLQLFLLTKKPLVVAHVVVISGFILTATIMFKIDFTGGNEELILQHYTFQKERANKIIRLTWEWLISGNIIESCFSSVKINARRLWKCFLHSFDIRCARQWLLMWI